MAVCIAVIAKEVRIFNCKLQRVITEQRKKIEKPEKSLNLLHKNDQSYS